MIWRFPVNPKCPIRMPTNRMNVTPSETPNILILPRSTPNDITSEYSNTMCAIESGLNSRFSNHVIILLLFTFYTTLN